jgi:hypothetical protein
MRAFPSSRMPSRLGICRSLRHRRATWTSHIEPFQSRGLAARVCVGSWRSQPSGLAAWPCHLHPYHRGRLARSALAAIRGPRRGRRRRAAPLARLPPARRPAMAAPPRSLPAALARADALAAKVRRPAHLHVGSTRQSSTSASKYISTRQCGKTTM